MSKLVPYSSRSGGVDLSKPWRAAVSRDRKVSDRLLLALADPIFVKFKERKIRLPVGYADDDDKHAHHLETIAFAARDYIIRNDRNGFDWIVSRGLGRPSDMVGRAWSKHRDFTTVINGEAWGWGWEYPYFADSLDEIVGGPGEAFWNAARFRSRVRFPDGGDRGGPESIRQSDGTYRYVPDTAESFRARWQAAELRYAALYPPGFPETYPDSDALPRAAPLAIKKLILTREQREFAKADGMTDREYALQLLALKKEGIPI